MDQVAFKFFGWLINIDKILMFVFIASIVLLFTRWWRIGRGGVFSAVLILFSVAILPTGNKLVSYLENRIDVPSSLPADAKGIILLGGSFNLHLTAKLDKPSYNMAAGRIIDFVMVAAKYPNLPLVFTGAGNVPDPKANEAANMKKLLPGFNIDPARFTYEEKSKSTIENAKFSYDLIKPALEDKWVLVTSAFQMPRAVGLFRKAGWNVIPYPVDFHAPKEVSWLDFNLDLGTGLMAWATGIREIGGMTANYLAGRSDEWIPK